MMPFAVAYLKSARHSCVVAISSDVTSSHVIRNGVTSSLIAYCIAKSFSIKYCIRERKRVRGQGTCPLCNVLC